MLRESIDHEKADGNDILDFIFSFNSDVRQRTHLKQNQLDNEIWNQDEESDDQ